MLNKCSVIVRHDEIIAKELVLTPVLLSRQCTQQTWKQEGQINLDQSFAHNRSQWFSHKAVRDSVSKVSKTVQKLLLSCQETNLMNRQFFHVLSVTS